MKSSVLRFIETIRKIFVLPPVLTVVIALPSFAFVVAALAGLIRYPALKYIAYILSAYALTVSVTGITRITAMIRTGFNELILVKRLREIPVVERLLEETLFRTELTLYPGFCINAVYAVFETAIGIYTRSAWFLSLGVYYLALALMRFSLLNYMRHKKEDSCLTAEMRRYRLCAYLLLLLNVALAGITILAVRKREAFHYPGYLIYVMAMYAFYAVVTATVNMIKYRKYGSPIMTAAKVVSMSAALVSMFSLETAMLAQFGSESSDSFRVLMTSITGAGINMIVLGMVVFMIIRSRSLLRRYADNTIKGK